MRRVFIVLTTSAFLLVPLFLLSCTACRAVKITLFADTDTFIERATDIVIARCVSSQEANGPWIDGLFPAEVDVISMIKGQRKPGALKIATIYSLEPGTNYLLASMGGSVYDTDFLALAELSVVPIPPDVDLTDLQGKPVKEQVQRVLARRLCDVQRALDPLEQEKNLLERGLRDKDYDLYTSPTKVSIRETRTACADDHDGNGIVYLDLKVAKLQWSRGNDESKTGYFYIWEPLGKTVWQFSRSTDTSIADFEGKVLKARFEERCPWEQAITVKAGEVILARRTDAPSVIYIIKLERQEKEKLFVEYAVVGHDTSTNPKKS